MRKTISFLLPNFIFVFASIIGIASDSAPNTGEGSPLDCARICLGPEQLNPSVYPKTCNGDIFLKITGLYWNAHQEGLEYALVNQVEAPETFTYKKFIDTLNNLVGAEYKIPRFKWEYGYKLGLGYQTLCDGWDIGVLWTKYEGKASSHIDATVGGNYTILPIWSAFSQIPGCLLYATDIKTHWDLELDLIDLELGREFWVSKYLSLRPHVGLRISLINQDFVIQHKGGTWYGFKFLAIWPLNNKVTLENHYRGFGVRSGLDSVWNFGCGFGLYGNFAASIIYGRFSIAHRETNRETVKPYREEQLTPYGRLKILDTKEHFRASRAMLDVGMGLQWSGIFCNNKWGLTAMIGWEHHLFFGQNQWWRVTRYTDWIDFPLPNNNRENHFFQKRGDLDTQGWTLTLKVEF